MRKLIQGFFHKEKGVAAVEFGMTSFIFLGVVLAFFQLAYMCVISAELDYIVAASTKYSKNTVVVYGERPGEVFDKYQSNASKVADALVARLMGNNSVLRMTLNNRVQVVVCKATSFETVVQQLNYMIHPPKSKFGVEGVEPCDKSVFSYGSYYPYAVYQFRIIYKPFMSAIPVFGRFTQNMLTRRYVSLQEWLKTSPTQLKDNQ